MKVGKGLGRSLIRNRSLDIERPIAQKVNNGFSLQRSI